MVVTDEAKLPLSSQPPGRLRLERGDTEKRQLVNCLRSQLKALYGLSCSQFDIPVKYSFRRKSMECWNGTAGQEQSRTTPFDVAKRDDNETTRHQVVFLTVRQR